MPRGKVSKWRENAGFSCVHQPPVREIAAGATYMRGRWGPDVFGRSAPLVLELGCGRGEYTLALAERDPDRDHVGVDIKGHRFWHGAQRAEHEGRPNVAFLRTRIEYVDHCFGEDEVAEIWLTFPDPQPADERGTKRLTSPVFMRRYGRFLRAGSPVHLKTDSALLFERTREDWSSLGLEIAAESDDVHGRGVPGGSPELAELLDLRTRYEEMWMARGHRIHYLQAHM